MQADGQRYKDLLDEIESDKSQPGNFRVMAIRELLDRGYGKAAQQIKAAIRVGVYDWDKLPDDQLQLVYDSLKSVAKEASFWSTSDGDSRTGLQSKVRS